MFCANYYFLCYFYLVNNPRLFGGIETRSIMLLWIHWVMLCEQCHSNFDLTSICVHIWQIGQPWRTNQSMPNELLKVFVCKVPICRKLSLDYIEAGVKAGGEVLLGVSFTTFSILLYKYMLFNLYNDTYSSCIMTSSESASHTESKNVCIMSVGLDLTEL